jgi:hypothetical protein
MLNHLALKNKHARDTQITFYEDGHRYDLIHPLTNTIVNPISVTTLIHEYCQEFNADLIIHRMMNGKNWPQSQYYGLTKNEIKKQWDDNRDQAASLGTKMHFDIECYLNGYEDVVNTSMEFQYFKNFWQDFSQKYPKFKPYRTEMIVWDATFRNNRGVCGSIDCILKDDEDRLIVLDWKRSKEIKFENRYQYMQHPFNHLPDSNYSHYSLQLSIYRHLLQQQYQMKVIDMMLVIFHPNQKDYHCVIVEPIELSSLWDHL